MDVMLMLHGVDRHCPDCATTTIFLPVLDDDGAATDALVCTACDGAVVVGRVGTALAA